MDPIKQEDADLGKGLDAERVSRRGGAGDVESGKDGDVEPAGRVLSFDEEDSFEEDEDFFREDDGDLDIETDDSRDYY